MKSYIKHDPWKIIEEGFVPQYNKISESIFSIGNGKTGQRANFEEDFSGETLKGSYVSGVYYPDKTRVGWWKNGYPEYFAKMLNAPSWIGLKFRFNGEILDLATCSINKFRRELDMKNGLLYRCYNVVTPKGKEIKAEITRFLCADRDETGVIKYAFTPLNFKAKVKVLSDVDADIKNEDSNYDEKFWTEVNKIVDIEHTMVNAETKKTKFRVCTAVKTLFTQNGKELKPENITILKGEKYAGLNYTFNVNENEETVIYKYASICSTFYYNNYDLETECFKNLDRAVEAGYETLKNEQSAAWNEKWKESDIIIDGDVAAQQGIRFNIFQLNQTYTGRDERLNIGPKGFTGEKYGGTTYWDTEAYCLPFYLASADKKVAHSLLVYRYKHLSKAIENAQKLGFKDGAALYPMVTVNGEECHNEWEITFEELHRNAAIANAVKIYIDYTGDKKYLAEYGLEVLVGISRFWAQRVNFSTSKQKYVMLGVTGPNEYENNVNNNWYTSYSALKNMKYTITAAKFVKDNYPEDYQRIIGKNHFDFEKETAQWQNIIDNMYLPYSEKLGIYLQQDDYLDKELIPVKDLSASQRPICQKWSWDRILRSCYIKQADVLQGMYFFESDFDIATIKKHFDFYEQFTVHESSLSSCIHSILASKIGDYKKAYDFYLNASRLDLDDYNNDTKDGCHITGMAGTWMTVVHGFGGMRINDGVLSFTPVIPSRWNKYSFMIRHGENIYKINIDKDNCTVENLGDYPGQIYINNEKFILDGHKSASGKSTVAPV